MYYIDRKEVTRAVNNKTERKRGMTDRQTAQFLEAIKIIAEKSPSKETFLEALSRIQSIGKKKPQ